MRYRNTRDAALSFEIAGALYEVPAGSLVEVEDKWSYCIATRGLPLVEAEQEAGPVVRPRYNVRAGVIRLPDGIELVSAREVEDDSDEDDAGPDVTSDLVPAEVAAALAPKPNAAQKRRR